MNLHELQGAMLPISTRIPQEWCGREVVSVRMIASVPLARGTITLGGHTVQRPPYVRSEVEFDPPPRFVPTACLPLFAPEAQHKKFLKPGGYTTTRSGAGTTSNHAGGGTTKKNANGTSPTKKNANGTTTGGGTPTFSGIGAAHGGLFLHPPSAHHQQYMKDMKKGAKSGAHLKEKDWNYRRVNTQETRDGTVWLLCGGESSNPPNRRIKNHGESVQIFDISRVDADGSSYPRDKNYLGIPTTAKIGVGGELVDEYGEPLMTVTQRQGNIHELRSGYDWPADGTPPTLKDWVRCPQG